LALRYGTATGGGPTLALDAGAAGLNYLIISTTSSNGSVGANALGIYDGTDYRLVLKSGNLGIGEVAPTSRLHIKGSGSTSATTSLLVQNSAGTQLMSVRDDGVNTMQKLVLTSSLRLTNINTENDAYTSIYLNGSNGNAYFPQTITIGAGLLSPNASAKLQVDSTTSGFLPPRMTTTQKNAIASPAAGLVLYDSTTNKLCCYDGSTWNDLF
jgi:hypothetical protein